MKTTDKRIRLINGTFKNTYGYRGYKDGYSFDNYQLCTTPIGNLHKWARDMIDACED